VITKARSVVKFSENGELTDFTSDKRKKTEKFTTACKDDYTYKYPRTKTAKIKKVILLCTTSPICQCGAD